MNHWLGSVGMLSDVVTFSLGSARVCSPAIFETRISYHKDLRIAVTNYYIYFYFIVPFPLTAILINLTASYVLV